MRLYGGFDLRPMCHAYIRHSATLGVASHHSALISRAVRPLLLFCRKAWRLSGHQFVSDTRLMAPASMVPKCCGVANRTSRFVYGTDGLNAESMPQPIRITGLSHAVGTSRADAARLYSAGVFKVNKLASNQLRRVRFTLSAPTNRR